MEYRKLTELKKLPNNPRIIRDKQFKTLCDSIRDNPKYFEARPIILSNRTGEMVIIAGNQRYEAAKYLKLKEVPTFLIEGLDEAKEREIVIRDNISNGEFDIDLLANEWSDLPLVDWGVDLPEDWLVEEKTDPADAEPQIDRAEELNKTWRVKPGDLWQIGEHRLLCGDSTKKEDVGRVMGGEKAGFCFTSPPYADMRDYSGDDMSVEKIASFIPASADFCEFYAVNLGLKRQDGEIQPYWNQYISFAKSAGLKLTAWNIWSRAGMGGSIANMSAMFPIEHEWVFVFGGNKHDVRDTKKNKSAGLHTRISNRQKDGTTQKVKPKLVKEYGRMGSVFSSCYATGEKNHPAAFPLEFPSEYIKACSDEGCSIYEPFCGSGTTMVACQNLNRKCRGIEISPSYCAVILQRMTDAFPGIEIKRLS
jgi:DNA modification methylase